MTYALDSDSLTLLSYGHARLSERARGVPPAELGVPILVRAEVLAGRLDALRKAATGAEMLAMQDRLDKLERFLTRFRIAPFDETAAAHFDRLRGDRRTKKVGHDDLVIASIALAHDATLVTRNLKDFKLVPGLKVVNWAD